MRASAERTELRAALRAEQEGRDTVVRGFGALDLAVTLDCGQAFRWEPEPDRAWRGTAHGRVLRVRMRADGALVLERTAPEEFERVWRRYFDLDRDYDAVRAAVSSDPVLRRAFDFSAGLRVLRQEPWETLCTFILSQNNHIPRIKGIVARLCETFGEPLSGGGASFPPPERLAACSVDDLAPLRAGFRAKYLLDAARRVAGGEVPLEALETAPLEDARDCLTRIMGVGPKVADCTLLFGFGRVECFPEDVWIRRAVAQLFGGRLPPCARPYAGIVQQALFYYARTTRLKI